VPEHSESSTEFKNENIVVLVKRKPGAQCAFHIVVLPLAADVAYSKALKSINKEVTLPGFRKGKAPDPVIIQKFEKQIEQEWRDIVIQTAFQEAIALTGLFPIRKGEARCTEIKELSRTKGARLTIEFEVLPEIPLIDPSEIILKRIQQLPVTESDIEEVLSNIRHHFAKWHDVTDRPIQVGDYVELDVENLETEPPESICRDTLFVIEPGKIADWMYHLILGATLGESREAISEKDPILTNPNVEFKATKCRLTVKSIKTADLPEFSEELIKQVGAKSLSDLREKIEIDLNRRAEEQASEALHRQLDEYLLGKYQIDIPTSLMQNEKATRQESIEEEMRRDGLQEEEITTRLAALDADLEEQVQKSYSLFFLMHAYAKSRQIAVSAEEVTQELARQVMQGRGDAFMGRSPEEVKARLTEVLLMRKTRDAAIAQAQIQ
jgi:trigger factor